MVIGREVDARRAVGLHVVGRAIRVEGHGPFLLGQAWEPNDDHFVSNVDHRPRGPRRQGDAAFGLNGQRFGELHRLADCVGHSLIPRI